ncbi:hypothetical protein BD414DRAFT_37008 [Trametes punicea]|nr:hypothetical protein BD414DRAFT_37008 [Trametes punicea]
MSTLPVLKLIEMPLSRLILNAMLMIARLLVLSLFFVGSCSQLPARAYCWRSIQSTLKRHGWSTHVGARLNTLSGPASAERL